MSVRFVAPAPPPPLRASSEISQIVQDKNEPLPPPVHPALARRRTPIPPTGSPAGALNSTFVPRSVSPAPPVPPRPPQPNEQILGLDTQPVDIPQPNIPQQPELADIQPSDLDFAHTRSESSASLLSSEGPGTPLLLVTTVGGTRTDGNASHESTLKTDALPPYASQPELPTQIYPEPPSSMNSEPPRPSVLDTHIPTQYHNVITETPTPLIPPPPIHPSRQPSPSPSFATLPAPAHPSLRQRVQYATPNRGSETPPSRPAMLEHARRGSGASILTLKNDDLTDEQLRAMYDAEEVQRYLRLFASRVNEVALHPDHADTDMPSQTYNDEEDWISLDAPPAKQTVEVSLPPNLQNPSTPFEYIAALVYPYVPQHPPPPAKRRFKLSKAANSAERLYLAAYPAYIPVIVHLWRLAIWKDPKRSGFFCAVYWTAWVTGLLTPLVTGRILYALVTGGTVTREEIKRRREAAREAEALGRAIEGAIPGVGISGELSLWDIAKVVKNAGKKKQKKAKTAIGEVKKDEGTNEIESEETCDESDDWKLMLVELADELADLHERIKNIFLHRRPAVTRRYTIALTLLFLGTFLVQNTSKFITLTMGFIFWFIPPIARLLPTTPPAFADAPTDAEVAMELISRRVARGERVVPERISKRKKNKERDQTDVARSASASNLNLPDTLSIRSPSMTSLLAGSEDSDDEAAYIMPNSTRETPAPQEDIVRKGAVRAWNWLGKTKQLVDQVRGVEVQGTVYAAPGQSFPAQHGRRPGMLMISSTMLTFSPLFASTTPPVPSPATNVIKVDIEQLRGVKKVTPNGILVRYVKGSEVVEERFFLLSGRDEAFATLVGWGGVRWRHV